MFVLGPGRLEKAKRLHRKRLMMRAQCEPPVINRLLFEITICDLITVCDESPFPADAVRLTEAGYSFHP